MNDPKRTALIKLVIAKMFEQPGMREAFKKLAKE